MRVQPVSRSQILQDFGLRFQDLAANGNRGFRLEFEELEEVGKDLPMRAGDSEVNRDKNRYPYVLPYDHCRVRLSVQNSQQHSDYINANFVPGGGSERDFICTQGPLSNTVCDFWRMVWEQNVRVVVMVTALRHKDWEMCERYWPLDRGSVHYGLIQVTTVTRRQGPDYFISTIHLRQRDCPSTRTITHYYYPAWPDRGIPQCPASLCAFTEHVRQELEATPRLGPAVVHCSAGVGRSGTFVTLLWMMQLCARGIRPDVRAAVEDLRLHRMWMVQNLEQYVFVHQCLLHWLSGGTSVRPQTQGGGSILNHQVQAHSSSSSSSPPRGGAGGGAGGGRGGGRRRHHHHQHRQTEQQPQNVTVISNPAKFLRRLLPSSSRSNSHSS